MRLVKLDSALTGSARSPSGAGWNSQPLLVTSQQSPAAGQVSFSAGPLGPTPPSDAAGSVSCCKTVPSSDMRATVAGIEELDSPRSLASASGIDCSASQALSSPAPGSAASASTVCPGKSCLPLGLVLGPSTCVHSCSA